MVWTAPQYLGLVSLVLTLGVAIRTRGLGKSGVYHLIEAGVDTLLITKVTSSPLFRFIAVGGAAFVLDAALVWGLTHIGLSAYVARALSLCASVAFTFVLNRIITFQASGPVKLQEVGAYIWASGMGIAINYGLYAGCLKLGLGWLPAMVVGTGVASAFNFLAYGRIFKKG